MHERLFQWAAVIFLLATVGTCCYVEERRKIKGVLKWLLLDFSGFRLVHSKIVAPAGGGHRYPSFILWIASLYVASFWIASQSYEKQLDLAEDRVSVIAALLSAEAASAKYDAKMAIEKIPAIQKMACPYRPELGIPISVFKSLFLADAFCDPAIAGSKEIVEVWKQRLSGINLDSGDLSGAQLENSNFSRARLKNANLSWASIRKSDLSRADLRGANLTRAELWESDLSRADFNDANLFEVRLQRTNLSGAKMQRVDLSMANLWKANLSKAYLRKSNLSRVFAWDADLSGASLWDANLEMAYLKGANLSGARLGRANLTDAFLWDANLSEANLEGANVSGVRFWGSNLTKAEGLTFDQLSTAQSLYGVRGLDPELENELRERHPELFKEPADKPKRKGDSLSPFDRYQP